MWLLLVLLFIVGPIVELYFIIQVSHVIGGWETIALLLFESMVGAWLMKRQGLEAVRRIQGDLEASRLPTKSLADGFLILFAAALLLTPGFITDFLGFLLLIPVTRAPIRAMLLRILTARLGSGFAAVRFVAGSTDGRRTRSRQVYDTTGRPVHDDGPQLDRPALGPEDDWPRP